MSARSCGTKISTLNLAVISSTCFTTGFFMARICPSLPVHRLSFMKLRQLLTWVWTNSIWSRWAARVLSFCCVIWSSWPMSSVFLTSSASCSFWMVLWMFTTITSLWSMIFWHCVSNCCRDFVILSSCCSTCCRLVTRTSLCFWKTSVIRSYCCSRWIWTVQSRHTVLHMFHSRYLALWWDAWSRTILFSLEEEVELHPPPVGWWW